MECVFVMKIINKVKHITNNIVRKNNNKQYISKQYISLGKRIFKISKSFGEPISISLFIEDDKFIINEVETILASKFKEKLRYSGEDDYEDSEPTAWSRGIL